MIYLIVALVLIMVLLIYAARTNISVKEYEVFSDKLKDSVTIAVVADLHSCDYGPNQKFLIGEIDKYSPDIIVMPGDIIDDRRPTDKSVEFFNGIKDKYKTFYVTGNHEMRTEDPKAVKELVASYGITVLSGNSQRLKSLVVCGIDDYEIGEEEWYSQLNSLSENNNEFRLLLSHRPERIGDYKERSFDLVVCGHAHGGQWRIPKLLNGLYAPDQGLFPKLAGGKYTFDKTTLIVSRGLAKETTSIPRFFNPPELIIVRINENREDAIF